MDENDETFMDKKHKETITPECNDNIQDEQFENNMDTSDNTSICSIDEANTCDYSSATSDSSKSTEDCNSIEISESDDNTNSLYDDLIDEFNVLNFAHDDNNTDTDDEVD